MIRHYCRRVVAAMRCFVMQSPVTTTNRQQRHYRQFAKIKPITSETDAFWQMVATTTTTATTMLCCLPPQQYHINIISHILRISGSNSHNNKSSNKNHNNSGSNNTAAALEKSERKTMQRMSMK